MPSSGRSHRVTLTYEMDKSRQWDRLTKADE